LHHGGRALFGRGDHARDPYGIGRADLAPPTRTIGRRTDEAIRAGVLLGTADAVDGLVRRIKAEWPNGKAPHVIATGGLASLVAPLAREIEAVHPDLTLTGLRIAAGALGLTW